jgi:hypothetical protein
MRSPAAVLGVLHMVKHAAAACKKNKKIKIARVTPVTVKASHDALSHRRWMMAVRSSGLSSFIHA